MENAFPESVRAFDPRCWAEGFHTVAHDKFSRACGFDYYGILPRDIDARHFATLKHRIPFLRAPHWEHGARCDC